MSHSWTHMGHYWNHLQKQNEEIEELKWQADYCQQKSGKSYYEITEHQKKKVDEETKAWREIRKIRKSLKR